MDLSRFLVQKIPALIISHRSPIKKELDNFSLNDYSSFFFRNQFGRQTPSHPPSQRRARWEKDFLEGDGLSEGGRVPPCVNSTQHD
ncbi:hypothetical protein CDAR_435141 [Caerostris darwini]|uniref:Uncharacterized protein n=1 Tax=Caerostris darwini TaxID=1538125 RepID=A0AAV4SFX8_9ARAC|nr:hypothetical protein CDAR_435141 [Caerostris darwini]